MRRGTWAQFHYAVKMVLKNESIIRSTTMAEAIAQDDNHNLWREGRQMKGKGNRMPEVIDGISGDKEISEILVKKFGTLYNFVVYDPDHIKMVENSVHNLIEENINDDVIEGMTNINDLNNDINQIKRSKSDGYLGLYSDHIINGTDKMYELLFIMV